jgi:hypothetical protein
LNPRKASGSSDAAIRARALRAVLSAPFVSSSDADLHHSTRRNLQWTQLASGLVARGGHALTTKGPDIRIFIEKLVRGLYFFHYKRVLPVDARIVARITSQESEQALFEGLRMETLTWKGVPPGFRYIYALPRDSFQLVWLFVLWERIVLFAGMGSRAKDAASVPDA